MKSFNDLRVLVDRKKKTNISISNELNEKMQKQRQENGSVTKSTVNHDAYSPRIHGTAKASASKYNAMMQDETESVVWHLRKRVAKLFFKNFLAVLPSISYETDEIDSSRIDSHIE